MKFETCDIVKHQILGEGMFIEGTDTHSIVYFRKHKLRKLDNDLLEFVRHSALHEREMEKQESTLDRLKETRDEVLSANNK